MRCRAREGRGSASGSPTPGALPASSFRGSKPHVVHRKQYKPHMVSLRNRLAIYIRLRRGGLTQREFARRTGVAQSTIMRIENEDQNVTLKTLEQLCRAFRVDVAELFPEEPPVPSAYHRHAAIAGQVHEPVVEGKDGSGRVGGQGRKRRASDASSPAPGRGGARRSGSE